MIRDLAIVREAASRIAQAVDGVVGALKESRVEQEPAFTDRMLGAIELTMNGAYGQGASCTGDPRRSGFCGRLFGTAPYLPCLQGV